MQKEVIRISVPHAYVKRINVLAKHLDTTYSDVLRMITSYGLDNYTESLGGKTRPMYVRMDSQMFKALTKRAKKEKLPRSKVIGHFIEDYFNIGDEDELQQEFSD